MRRLLRLIRNIAALVILAVVLLAGVLAYNTLSNTSRQIEVAALPRAPVDEDAVSKRLAVAIQLQTIADVSDPDKNADAFRGILAHIEVNYPAFGATMKREVVANYSLLYTWQGSDPNAKPIALLAHQDVVPIAPGTEGDWEAPPFGGVIKDGFIWGRGSWDDKGNLFAMVEAAEQLAKQGFKPKRTIYFAFGADEEISGKRGATAMAALLQSRGVKLDFVLDEGLLITDGIIKGVLGGSTANKTGGAGGTALTRNEGPVLDAYFALLRERLLKALDKPAGLSDTLVAEVEFRLNADGSITGAKIIGPSGSAEFDRAVLDAYARVRLPERPDKKSSVHQLRFRTKDLDGI